MAKNDAEKMLGLAIGFFSVVGGYFFYKKGGVMSLAGWWMICLIVLIVGVILIDRVGEGPR